MSGHQDGSTRTATISVLVDNEAGILARVIGLFTGRGYNIDSLTVAPVEANDALSRINLVTSGTAMVITQIKAQLNRLVQVHRVSDLTEEGPHVAREMALVKVVGTGEKRVEHCVSPKRSVPGSSIPPREVLSLRLPARRKNSTR